MYGFFLGSKNKDAKGIAAKKLPMQRISMMLSKVASDIFNQIVQPHWNRSVNSAQRLRLWHKSFIKVAKESNIIDADLASSLSSSHSLLSLMHSSFDKDQQFPSAQLFAINIAYEMSLDSFDCDLDQIPELWRLRFFASAVRFQWLVSIENSFFLKNTFMDLHHCQPVEYHNIDSECPAELDLLMCDSKALACAFHKGNQLDSYAASYTNDNLDEDCNDLTSNSESNNAVIKAGFSGFDKPLKVA